jgi:hypothetical protein
MLDSRATPWHLSGAGELAANAVLRENGTIETVRKQAKKTEIAEAQFADRCHA